MRSSANEFLPAHDDHDHRRQRHDPYPAKRTRNPKDIIGRSMVIMKGVPTNVDMDEHIKTTHEKVPGMFIEKWL